MVLYQQVGTYGGHLSTRTRFLENEMQFVFSKNGIAVLIVLVMVLGGCSGQIGRSQLPITTLNRDDVYRQIITLVACDSVALKRAPDQCRLNGVMSMNVRPRLICPEFDGFSREIAGLMYPGRLVDEQLNDSLVRTLARRRIACDTSSFQSDSLGRAFSPLIRQHPGCMYLLMSIVDTTLIKDRMLVMSMLTMGEEFGVDYLFVFSTEGLLVNKFEFKVEM